jgi:hypothetical protein
MKIFYSIIVILSFLPAEAQVGLDKLIKNQEPKALLAFQKKTDRFFSNDWVFKNLTAQEIDHFKMGYVLTWQKKMDGLLIQRSYLFDNASKFAYAHEHRFLNDTLFSQGSLYLKGDTLNYFIQVIPEKKSLNYKNGSYWDYKVDYYTYEIFQNGALSCIYKVKKRNHYEMLFESRADKIELVKGNDCLSIL